MARPKTSRMHAIFPKALLLASIIGACIVVAGIYHAVWQHQRSVAARSADIQSHHRVSTVGSSTGHQLRYRSVPFQTDNTSIILPRASELWASCVAKGRASIHFFNTPSNQELPADKRSPFQRPDRIAEAGWESKQVPVNEFWWEDVKPALDAMEIPSDEKDENVWVAYTHTHGDTGDYRTHARYESVFNTHDGVLVSLDSVSPDKIRDPPEGYWPPPLKHWSDVNFLTWQQVSQENVQDVEFIIRVNIAKTKPTSRIIEEAIGKVPVWPGVSVAAGTELFEALLGTPHGQGVAYFLFQHKNQLGSRRYVEKIWVWDPDTPGHGSEEFNNMLFQISDPERPEHGQISGHQEHLDLHHRQGGR